MTEPKGQEEPVNPVNLRSKNLNVPVNPVLFTRMKEAKDSMGPSITWENYFENTLSVYTAPMDSYDFDLLKVDVKVAEHTFRYSPKTHEFAPIGTYRKYNGQQKPQLQSIVTQVGDGIVNRVFKWDPKEPGKMKPIREFHRKPNDVNLKAPTRIEGRS